MEYVIILIAIKNKLSKNEYNPYILTGFVLKRNLFY